MAKNFYEKKAEVNQRLWDCREKLKLLENMRHSRDTSTSQRYILVGRAFEFVKIVRDALDGRYEGNPIFTEKPELKLATEIISLNEGFSNLMLTKGHRWEFASSNKIPAANYDDENDEPEIKNMRLRVSNMEYEAKVSKALSSLSVTPELRQVPIDGIFEIVKSSRGPIKKHIEGFYKDSHGPGLGMFGRSLLATIFQDQTADWQPIVMAHVEMVVIVVHRFIKALMKEVFVEKQMREELWDRILLDKFREAYRRAIEQAHLLLEVEQNDRPSTYNRVFNGNLQRASFMQLAQPVPKAEFHDILKSYYEIARQRLVDAVCRQVVENFLLDGRDGALSILTPQLFSNGTISDNQLNAIAGEDTIARRERKRLESEIWGLEIALEVLEG